MGAASSQIESKTAPVSVQILRRAVPMEGTSEEGRRGWGMGGMASWLAEKALITQGEASEAALIGVQSCDG